LAAPRSGVVGVNAPIGQEMWRRVGLQVRRFGIARFFFNELPIAMLGHQGSRQSLDEGPLRPMTHRSASRRRGYPEPALRCDFAFHVIAYEAPRRDGAVGKHDPRDIARLKRDAKQAKEQGALRAGSEGPGGL